MELQQTASRTTTFNVFPVDLKDIPNYETIKAMFFQDVEVENHYFKEFRSFNNGLSRLFNRKVMKLINVNHHSKYRSHRSYLSNVESANKFNFFVMSKAVHPLISFDLISSKGSVAFRVSFPNENSILLKDSRISFNFFKRIFGLKDESHALNRANKFYDDLVEYLKSITFNHEKVNSIVNINRFYVINRDLAIINANDSVFKVEVRNDNLLLRKILSFISPAGYSTFKDYRKSLTFKGPGSGENAITQAKQRNRRVLGFKTLGEVVSESTTSTEDKKRTSDFGMRRYSPKTESIWTYNQEFTFRSKRISEVENILNIPKKLRTVEQITSKKVTNEKEAPDGDMEQNVTFIGQNLIESQNDIQEVKEELIINDSFDDLIQTIDQSFLVSVKRTTEEDKEIVDESSDPMSFEVDDVKRNRIDLIREWLKSDEMEFSLPPVCLREISSVVTLRHNRALN